MSTTNFNLRGMDSNIMTILKQSSEKQGMSVNALILKCIEKALGYSYKINRPIYQDLDHLAGTWTEKDVKVFNENTAYFEKVDEDLWS
jgi:hypothetical protein